MLIFALHSVVADKKNVELAWGLHNFCNASTRNTLTIIAVHPVICYFLMLVIVHRAQYTCILYYILCLGPMKHRGVIVTSTCILKPDQTRASD